MQAQARCSQPMPGRSLQPSGGMWLWHWRMKSACLLPKQSLQTPSHGADDQHRDTSMCHPVSTPQGPSTKWLTQQGMRTILVIHICILSLLPTTILQALQFCWSSSMGTESPNSSDMRGTWHREELDSESGTKSPELTTSLWVRNYHFDFCKTLSFGIVCYTAYCSKS